MFKDVIVARPQSGDWLRFRKPVAVVAAYEIPEVVSLLEDVESRVNGQGLHAAGFVSYEAAPAFDSALATRAPGDLPLACFGLYRTPEVVTEVSSDRPGGAVPWRNPTGRAAYRRALAHIKRQIAVGNVYQVNHTLRLCAEAVPGWELFTDIAADAPYGAFIDADGFSIVSASPELFFTLQGARLVSRPMKGTAARGLTLAQDRTQREWLAGSDKNRAENLMITDMVRNDLGRIARVGSVRVEELFRVEKYPTVWQMTSTVTAETLASVAQIFEAMFPGASITGAPKRASMEYIVQLEDSPREIYTGCIGYVAPGRDAQFSIAIRTAWTNKPSGQMRYGVGGGIVWDSNAAEELAEIAVKSRVLKTTRSEQGFELLETMRWSPESGVENFPWHLCRLTDSADYFDFACRGWCARAVETALAEALVGLEPVRQRVRLRLNRSGLVTVQCDPLASTGQIHSAPQELILATEPIDADNPFLYHKTTNRDLYEKAARCLQPHQEALLFNTRGLVTETNIANVVFRDEEGLFTPPVSDGLLPGTMRARLLEEGKLQERQLAVADLNKVAEIHLINSLRGWRRGQVGPC